MRRITKGLTLGSVGLLLCTAGAHAQGGTSEPPAPPETPRIVKPRSPFAITTPGATVSVNSSWTMSETVDGRSVTVRGKGDEITAEIDGKAVPKDRVQRQGVRVVVTDDKGAVVFDRPVLMGSVGGASALSPLFGISTPGNPLGAWSTGPGAAAITMNSEPPKVMVGVQLVDLDSSLIGHFGLKEDEGTLVAAVYEGLPASAAGLEPYDIIVAINGKSVGPGELRQTLRESEPGKPIALDVIHRGQRKTINVTPEKYDREKMEKAKVAAIEASEPAEGIAVAPGMGGAWAGQGGTFIGRGSSPRDIMVFQNGQQLEELQRRMEKQAEEQARKADRLNTDLDRTMQQRLRQMEEQIKALMEQHNRLMQPAPQNPAAPPAPAAPAQPAPAGSSSRLPIYDLSWRSA
ncbi:MAG: PDZ domain-containing protein [Phycisphaerales bacterium]|nr:PDZ domain-containing protein [Phycisphaerales bacterium]